MSHPVRVRTATGWQDLALMGPSGPPGSAGPAGSAGPPGVPGGLFHSQTIGDGASKSFTVGHGLGTRGVSVSVYRTAAPYDEVQVEVEHTDANTVTVRTTMVPVAGEFTVVVASPGGTGGGGDLNYAYTQNTPSATWTIIHNLAKYPAVTVIDSGDNTILANLHYDDANVVTVSFGSPTSGKAYVN